MKFYRQCTLRHKHSVTVAWIEERGARLGCQVTLEDSEDPSLFWTVETVSRQRVSQTEAQEKARESVKFARAGSLGGLRGNK